MLVINMLVISTIDNNANIGKHLYFYKLQHKTI